MVETSLKCTSWQFEWGLTFHLKVLKIWWLLYKVTNTTNRCFCASKKKTLLVRAHTTCIIHFTENVPKPTFAKWVNCWLYNKYNKDEGAVQHNFNSRVAVDLRTCYCIKDEYLTKHKTSEHYVGIADFDLDAVTADLPDQEQQESLQRIKPDCVIITVWINYCQKWTEFAPGDRSIWS